MAFNCVMHDAETLGTYADSVIMSLGAVAFNLETGEIDDAGFYASISVDSNLSYGRQITEDTLIWWFKQKPQAQAVFHEQKVSLEAALTQYRDWLHSKFPKSSDVTVWANGADFDTPMLSHAFRQIGIDTPWEFWNSRCFRTYKTLPGARAIPNTMQGVKHNALFDAVSQATHVCAIHKGLFRPETAKKGKK